MIYGKAGAALNSKTYDPEAFFCVNGTTNLHSFANSYSQLFFLLNEYDKSRPQLINMLLLKDSVDKNVLQLALEKQSQRSVNLILEKLAKIQRNNIHQVKQDFGTLLEYKGFEKYLQLCLFQTKQMKDKTLMRCKQQMDENTSLIESHPTCFLDKNFYDKFADEENEKKWPVVIQAIDAGWIFKQEEGREFLISLSESEEMSYFQLETIRILITY